MATSDDGPPRNPHIVTSVPEKQRRRAFRNQTWIGTKEKTGMKQTLEELMLRSDSKGRREIVRVDLTVKAMQLCKRPGINWKPAFIEP